jgi:outer membrane protein assembly factor BamB
MMIHKSRQISTNEGWPTNLHESSLIELGKNFMRTRTGETVGRRLREGVLKMAICVGLVVGGMGSVCGGAEWVTSRGNVQRTGTVDGLRGPKAGKVLWVYESGEHFIAAPVAGEKMVYVSALGAFNTAGFYALADEVGAKERVLWKKTPPGLKQAVVCPPVVSGTTMVFGDGMHQTDGGTLNCVNAETGLPLWQLPVPGTLVHLEGSATIDQGRVYIGGGSAGVLCVDMKRLTLDGQEVTLEAAKALLDAKWKELSAQYEADKKKDPDFAIPPDEGALPKPAPKVLWQMGKDKLHVDSALAVVGERVLAGSAALETEKVGDRALYCLDAKSGEVRWRTELRLNPWAGPTVSGDVVVLGCSSVRFEVKDIPQAKGEVVAMDLGTGQVRWKKELPGGVIAPVAVAEDVAICTATDGKVRALGVKDGREKWTYEAGAGFFAGAAVADGVAYVADLKGVVHAISMKDGEKVWTLDLANDPATKAPGMVFGSPVLHKGRLYVATCNLETGQQRTVVVCIGEK